MNYSKTGLNLEDFDNLLNLILQKVKIIPENILFVYKNKASELVKDIDINDAIFAACALAHPESIIWSDDKKLKKLKGIKVLNTNEIKELI